MSLLVYIVCISHTNGCTSFVRTIAVIMPASYSKSNINHILTLTLKTRRNPEGDLWSCEDQPICPRVPKIFSLLKLDGDSDSHFAAEEITRRQSLHRYVICDLKPSEGLEISDAGQWPIICSCLSLKDVVTEWTSGTGKYNGTNVFVIFVHLSETVARVSISLMSGWFYKSILICAGFMTLALNWATVRTKVLAVMKTITSGLSLERRHSSMFAMSPTSSDLLFVWQRKAATERKSVCAHIRRGLLHTLSLSTSPLHWHGIMERGHSLLEKFLRSATHTSPSIWAALVPLWSAYVLLKASNTSNRTAHELSEAFICFPPFAISSIA